MGSPEPWVYYGAQLCHSRQKVLVSSSKSLYDLWANNSRPFLPTMHPLWEGKSWSGFYINKRDETNHCWFPTSKCPQQSLSLLLGYGLDADQPVLMEYILHSFLYRWTVVFLSAYIISYFSETIGDCGWNIMRGNNYSKICQTTIYNQNKMAFLISCNLLLINLRYSISIIFLWLY